MLLRMSATERLKCEYPNIPPYEIEAIARAILAGCGQAPSGPIGGADVEEMIYHSAPRLLELRGFKPIEQA